MMSELAEKFNEVQAQLKEKDEQLEALKEKDEQLEALSNKSSG